MRVLRAAVWAAALSGIPSTVHALATGRDPLEAAYAAGTILLPGETRPQRLLAAAVPVHLGISIGWTVALDLGLLGRLFPRIRALPVAAQLADHAAFGAIAARRLQR